MRAAHVRGVKIRGVEFEGEQDDFATAPAALEGAAADIVLSTHSKLGEDAPVKSPSRRNRRLSGPTLLDRRLLPANWSPQPPRSPSARDRGHPHRGLERVPGPGPPANGVPIQPALVSTGSRLARHDFPTVRRMT
jgi:hypothetical protein